MKTFILGRPNWFDGHIGERVRIIKAAKSSQIPEMNGHEFTITGQWHVDTRRCYFIPKEWRCKDAPILYGAEVALLDSRLKHRFIKALKSIFKRRER
jgi:hypothetical protein